MNNCICGKTKRKDGLCDGSHINKSNNNITMKAFIKKTGNDKIDKIVGQVRHVLTMVFTLLTSFGLLGNLGINIPEESFLSFLNLLDQGVDMVYGIVGLVGQLLVHVSSWTTKD